jgi:phosphatidylserine/phosphatidylglycerophosphate/cardiolipin synthase-like enzyme
MQIFRDLRAKDVEIVGFTKPLGEKDSGTNSGKIHEDLQQVFKELRPVSKMHEKLAVFDQQIVWLGSLNILSHKNSTEIMVRIDSPDFAASLLNEYQNQRTSQGRIGYSRGTDDFQKEGDKCALPGCDGTRVMRRAGVSRGSGKAYEAFLGCTNYQLHPKS